MNTKKKVLFFISGPVPTAAQMAQADTITTNSRVVAFRNATQVGKDDGLERAEFVCGDVPARYLVEAKGWVPPKLIDFKQPELSFEQEVAPASPMAAVATGPTEDDVKAFSELNVDAVLAKVKSGELAREAAVELEKLGKGRKSLLARLTEAVD